MCSRCIWPSIDRYFISSHPLSKTLSFAQAPRRSGTTDLPPFSRTQHQRTTGKRVGKKAKGVQGEIPTEFVAEMPYDGEEDDEEDYLSDEEYYGEGGEEF